MKNELLTMEAILMLMPLVAIHLGLMIFSLVKIFKEGVANLNKGIWVLIVVMIELLGPAIFLIAGRRKDVK